MPQTKQKGACPLYSCPLYSDSKNHNHAECNARLSYNIAYGQYNFMKIGNLEIKSDYNDDVCFFLVPKNYI